MKNIFKILKLFATNNPIKKFNLEYQLMLAYSGKNKFLRKYFQRRLYYKYNCEISHTATIDHSVKFVHPIAIVVGSNAKIKKDCIIYQCVTIGTSFNCNNQMPHIKYGTTISTGAKILGAITIGENCIIGANTVVTKSIPANSTVVGTNKILQNSNQSKNTNAI